MNKSETNEVNIKLNRILQILESDEKTKQMGLVERSSDNSKRIYKIEQDKKIAAAKHTAYGVAGGGFISVLYTLVKFLFTKNI